MSGPDACTARWWIPAACAAALWLLAGCTSLAGGEGSAGAAAAVGGAGDGFRAERLRCELMTDPIGIDAPRPRLGWALADGAVAARMR